MKKEQGVNYEQYEDVQRKEPDLSSSMKMPLIDDDAFDMPPIFGADKYQLPSYNNTPIPSLSAWSNRNLGREQSANDFDCDFMSYQHSPLALSNSMNRPQGSDESVGKRIKMNEPIHCVQHTINSNPSKVVCNQMQMNSSMQLILPQFSNNRSASNLPSLSTNSTFSTLSPNHTFVSHQSYAQFSNPEDICDADGFGTNALRYYNYNSK